MNIRYVIHITGRVQRVGYRGFTRLIANRHGVVGYAENLADGSVRIIAEGEEEALSSFVSELPAPDEPLIAVENIEVQTAPYTGEFPVFQAHFGDMQKEMFARSELALEYMKEMIKWQKKSAKMQEELILAMKDMKKESRKTREALERVIEAIHTQGVG